MLRLLSAFAMRCAQRAWRSGSTRASFGAGMCGIRKSAAKSTTARSSFPSSRPIQHRGMKAISGSSGTWRISAPTCSRATGRSSCRCAWMLRLMQVRTFPSRFSGCSGPACGRRQGRNPRFYHARMEGRSVSRSLAAGGQAHQSRAAERLAPYHLQISGCAMAPRSKKSWLDDARGALKGEHRRRSA